MKNNRGITLVGIIMSVMVLALGIISVVALMTHSIRVLGHDTFEMEAQQIAREGLEAMRNFRDTNWKQNYPWDAFSYNGKNGCYKGANSMKQLNTSLSYQLALLSNERCPWFLNIVIPSGENPNDFFNETLATSTNRGKYYPFLTFTYLDEQWKPTTSKTDALQIESTVYWIEGSQVHSTTLTTVLTNWRSV